MAIKFNPFGTETVSSFDLIEDLTSQVQGGAIALNKKGDTSLLREGNGISGIEVSLSIRTGAGDSRRGAARMDLTGDQIADVMGVLRGFDPEARSESLEHLTPAECVERSIQVETPKEGPAMVSFKLSMKDHARSIRVPLADWDRFVEFMDSVGAWTEAAAAHYRNIIAEQEAAANAPADAPAE